MALGKFGEYVTSQAFTLTLSRPMIYELALTSLGKCDPDTRLNLSHLKALDRRGLVEWRWEADDSGGIKKGRDGEPMKTGPFITEAGKHTLRLCELANLIDMEVVASNKNLSARLCQSSKKTLPIGGSDES